MNEAIRSRDVFSHSQSLQSQSSDPGLARWLFKGSKSLTSEERERGPVVLLPVVDKVLEDEI